MLCPSYGRETPPDFQFYNGCGAKLDTPTGETLTPSEESTTTDDSRTFVGRQREMRALKAALEDALSGHGRLVMLVGEPGIGKTRTAQELAAVAQQRGAQVLWGWCYEEEGAPPYWPWVQPLRTYIQQKDPDQLRSQMGPGAADIAEIVSEVRDKLPGLGPLPTLEPQQARFRLFDSLCTFLQNASLSQPLVLVLDDLHWADTPSLLLLQFLARQMAGSSLLVIGCCRDVELSLQHPLSETLARLTREPTFQRQLLQGLDLEDTGRFIEASTGTRPSPGLLETIYAQTEGNPFFMAEVVRLLSEREELTAEEVGEPHGIQIPPGVREVIGERLNRLSEQCHQTLITAAIIGRVFDFNLLSTLGDEITEDQLLEMLEEALAARVIEELLRAAGCYQFSHTLIQETLVGELSLMRQARLHARIGAALEEQYGADGAAHATELAYHFAQAVSVIGTEKLARYSLLAGERGLATYAYEEALAHFERARAAKEGQPMDAEMAALLFGLGRAQAAMFQRREALANLSRAFDYYVEVRDVAAAVAVAEYPITPGIGRLRVTQLIGRALALVPPDSHVAGRLLCRYGLSLSNEMGDYAGAQEALGRALTIAQREGDMVVEMLTLLNAAIVEGFHLHWQEAAEKSLQTIDLALGADDLHAEVRARFYAAFALFSMGDCEGARSQASAMLAPAERLRDRGWLANTLRVNQTASSLAGDWRAARSFNDQGLAVAPREPLLLGSRALLEYEVGDFTQGAAYLERLLDLVRLTLRRATFEYAIPAMVIPLITRITDSAVDRADIAEASAKTVLSLPSVVPLIALTAKAGLALLAVQRGDVVAAREQYSALESGRGTMALGGIIAVDRLLGLLAQTTGKLDQAITHFEDALAFCRKAGYRPELAWTCCDYSDALRERNDMGGRAKAMALLDESLDIASELGMRPLMERVITLQTQAASQPSRAPAYPNGLTQREVEVLCLVAAGKSDREIGEELFIGVRTVSGHVGNILNKINASNRTEAATYAARHGLV